MLFKPQKNMSLDGKYKEGLSKGDTAPRDYWVSGSGSWLHFGKPRTLMVSATVDF